jgi:hypothetical protein
MKINIEGTPLEIIANANNLKQVNDSNIFVNDKKERFILNPLGFTPVHIDTSWSLKMKYQGKIDSLKRENVKLNTLLDEMDFELTQRKPLEKMQGKINNLEKLLNECSVKKNRLLLKIERQVELNQAYNSFIEYLRSNIILGKEMTFEDVLNSIELMKNKLKKTANESINNTL